VPLGAGKAGALAYLATREGWRREEILAAGNTLNDWDMLVWAGKAVAVGNALEELTRLLPPRVHQAALPCAGGILEALSLFWPGPSRILEHYRPAGARTQS